MVLVSYSSARSQDYDLDSLIKETLAYDSLLLEELAQDSLSIIDLIDSLIKGKFKFSSLMIRAAYTSNIMNAGRDFGINQYGFSVGASYYHKTGLFGDLTSYWNSDVDPHINPTTVTFGYMGSILPKWSVIASYEHFFYTQNDSYDGILYPITDALNASTYLDLKHFSFGVDYSFMFGHETAHRIRPNMYGIIRIKTKGFINEINIFPSASLLLGNAMIYYLDENYSQLQSMLHQHGINDFQQFRKRRPRLAQYLITNYATYEERTENVFGIMNYSLSLPIMFRMNRFTLSTRYYINFPVALPGEEIDLSPNSYFNVYLLYSIPFGLKK
jgi:hypothetical protein